MNIDAAGKAHAVAAVDPADQVFGIVVIEHHEVGIVECFEHVDAFGSEAAGAGQSDQFSGHPRSLGPAEE